MKLKLSIAEALRDPKCRNGSKKVCSSESSCQYGYLIEPSTIDCLFV